MNTESVVLRHLNINCCRGWPHHRNSGSIILCSRLFLVHENGSGTELLSSQTVEEVLYQAYSDPTIAVLKEPLPDAQGTLLNIF